MFRRMIGLVGLTFALALAASLTLTGVTSAQGQQPRKPDAENRKETGRGDAKDPNIKVGPDQAIKEGKIPPPADKSGEKTRQMTCQVEFDNWSSDWIDAYADGSYRGRIPPWGELYTHVISGPTVLYATAANGSGSWGPRTVTCNRTYSWRLN